MNLTTRANQLKIDIPAVFLVLGRKETPIFAKIIAAITVVYALSPIDLIPDFIPVLGYIDDIIILPCLIAITIKLIPESLFEECRVQSANLFLKGNQKKWYYAIPIVLIWGALIFMIIKIIFF